MTMHRNRDSLNIWGGDPQPIGEILDANLGNLGLSPGTEEERGSDCVNRSDNEAMSTPPKPPEPAPVDCPSCKQSVRYTFRSPFVFIGKVRGNDWINPLRFDGICISCTELREEREVALSCLKTSGIPPHLQQQFTLENYRPETKSQIQIANLIRRIIDAERTPSGITPHRNGLTLPQKGFYLHGGVGLGKTHLASALISGLCRRGIHGVRVVVPAMLDQLRDSFKDRSHAGQYSTAKEATILLLDDIGCERVTDWVLERLFLLVDDRLTHRKLTYFTSNLSTGDLAIQLNERIASRIRELCDVIHIEGRDCRVNPQ